MKGIILAGGTGSRLGPLSKVTNKHLLPVGPVPMIYYPIAQLLENRITKICIVSGTHHLGSVVTLLGSGAKFGCEFTYRVQDQAGGIAEALLLCEDFSGRDDVAVFLGDNIFGNPMNLNVPVGSLATLYLKEVPDPERFGVAEVDHMKKLIDIEEKPASPKSNMAVTGAYVYTNDVWDVVNNISKSDRGEYEISDVNKALLKKGPVRIKEVLGLWSDAGTQESLKTANQKVWTDLSDPLMERIASMADAS